MTAAQATAARTASISRTTSESTIELSLDLDGTGSSAIDSSVPFFDHLLTAFAKHSLVDLTVKASGDTHIDVHHTVEDIGIALGTAIKQALGDKAGIVEKSGSWFSYDGTRIGQGRENAKQYLRDHPDVAAAIEQKVRANAGILANALMDGGKDDKEDDDE